MSSNRVEELEKRLEAATQSDWELSQDIHRVLTGVRPSFSHCNATYFYDKGAPDGSRTHTAPAYTASLDAAIALVERELPQCDWLVARHRMLSGGSFVRAQVTSHNAEIVGVAEGKPPPVALLLALVRALKNSPEKQPKDLQP